MKKAIFTILLLCSCSFNLFSQSNLTKEDYAVYATILDDIYTQQIKSYGVKTAFIISADTIKLNFVPSGVNKKPVSDYLSARI